MSTPTFAAGGPDHRFQFDDRRPVRVARAQSASSNKESSLPHKSKSKSPTSRRHTHGPSPKSRSRSLSPFGGHGLSPSNKKQNVMVCHESAHAIVFRDHLRLARKIIQEVEEEDDEDDSDNDGYDEEEGKYEPEIKLQHQDSEIRNSLKANEGSELVKEINHLAHDLVPELKTVTLDLKHVSERNIEIEGLHAHITPLEDLEWNQKTEFKALLKDTSPDKWTRAEREVVQMLKDQHATVKTIQKNEWPSFLQRFQKALPKIGRAGEKHGDIPPEAGSDHPFNSFVTSTSLLPSEAKKMRCYGSEISYPIGVVFGLPQFDSQEAENQAVAETQTWAWPAGYAAKTEFNIDGRGKLINGRQEALVSLEQMRRYNHEYLHAEDHYIAGRIIKGGFKVVPYNECFLRVGGPSRILEGKDVSNGQPAKRSLDKGVGLFVALFIRTTTMADIVQLLRTKARIAHVLGEEHVKDIPLLYLHNENGVRVFTRQMQDDFWKQASVMLQPFANPAWALTTKYHETNEKSLQHKIQEFLDLDERILSKLNHHELGKIAGGFGVTDRSFLELCQHQTEFQHVYEILQQSFAATIRANDYYAARQLLVLYSLANTSPEGQAISKMQERLHGIPAASYSDVSLLTQKGAKIARLPKPLATKRWRRATNSKGLLVVLGAAQILKTVTNRSAKRRAEETVEAVEEWVHHGEESVAFRVASWRNQRADEADSNIAMGTDAKFMAFVTNKSVTNRRKFAQQLRKSAPENDEFDPMVFLQGIYEIVCQMHSPCMRLELLQYILALDNRYSVELIKESMELAATCLSVIPQSEEYESRPRDPATRASEAAGDELEI